MRRVMVSALLIGCISFHNSYSLTFVAYGDSRTQANTHEEVVNRFAQENPELVIHSGDLWDDYTSSEWKSHFTANSNLASLLNNNKILVSRGNHESESEVLNFSPSIVKDNSIEYSFREGNSFFVSMGYDPGSNNAWLETQLQSAESQAADWRFIYAHKPVYSSCNEHGADGNTSEGSDVRNFRALCDQYKITMYFCGHDHLYERTHLIYEGQTASEQTEINIAETPGTFYVVTGGGGAPLYSGGSDWWVNVNEKTYHYCVLNASSDRLEYAVKDYYGHILDAVTIIKDSLPVDSGLVLTPAQSRIALNGSTALSVILVGGLSGSVAWSVDGGGTLSDESDSGAVFTSDGTEGTFTITSAVGDKSESVSIEVYDPAKYSVKLNCGGGAVEDWVSDAGFVSGGESFDWGESIDVAGVENAGPAAIYETVRHMSPHSYTFPVVDGDYTVRIHFIDRLASIHRDVTYNIEGTAVESGITIPEGPEVREYNVTISDGNGLTIECNGNGESDVFEAGIEVMYDAGSATEAYMAGFSSKADGLCVNRISGGRYRISASSDTEPFRVRIVSVSGSVVESFGKGSGIWNPKCASGLYFVEIESGTRRFREKVLVQR